jgi:hypothetical protein
MAAFQQQQQQQQQPHDYDNINAIDYTRTQQPSAVLDPPYHEPRMSQLPMNLARDDPGDGMTVGGASNTRSTIDSVVSFDSMRDVHEFIREVNGRRYNAQNTTYFLPAGQSSPSFYTPLFFPIHSPNPNTFSISDTYPDQIEYSRLCVPSPPCLSSIPHVIPRLVTSNISAIAFVLTSCTHTPIWSTSSYDLNSALRRK